MDNVKNSFEELKNLLLSAVDLMENIGEELETRVLVMEKKLLEMERRMEEYESIKKADGFEDILSAGGVVSAADMVGEEIVAEGVAMEDEELEMVEDRACGADIEAIDEECDIYAQKESAAIEKESDIMDVATDEGPIATTTSAAVVFAVEEETAAVSAEEETVSSSSSSSAAAAAEAAAEEEEEEAESEPEPEFEFATEEPVVASVEPVAEEIVGAAEVAAVEPTVEEEVLAEESAVEEVVAAAEDEKTDDIYTDKVAVAGEVISEADIVAKTVVTDDFTIVLAEGKPIGVHDSYKVAAETDVIKEETGTISVNDAAKPDWYDWEVDYPASYIDDIYKGISFNDRYEFVKELFNVTGNLSEAEIVFKETLDDINCMDNFKEVVAYIRHRFPQWDEQSDEVYRFYMIVRRKFNN